MHCPAEFLSLIRSSKTPTALVEASDTPLAMPIVCVNPAFCAWMRCTDDALLGRSSLLLAGARYNPSYLEMLRESSGTGQAGVHTKVRFDGTEVVASVRVRTIRNDAGRATHFLIEEVPRA